VADASPEFEDLLRYLKTSRGFDFTAYKRSTLQRRVQKRMAAVGAGSYADYVDYLEVHQDEFNSLFNTILINVTAFFRDRDAWDFLADTIVPRVIERKEDGDPIRVWVAGCASGEEAYTVAMVLAEALGTAAFRDRVKVYATDLDDEALVQCRVASYAPKDVQGVPPEFLGKYFETVNGRLVFDRELRRSIIFGKHDLIQDAPISRVDMLLCRNTLMYFNAEAQSRILSRFHFALNEGGFLFLGMAETLLTHGAIFVPVDLKHRVFSKVPRNRYRDRAYMMGLLESEMPKGRTVDTRLREAATEAVPLAQIVLDAEGHLIVANARARALFGISDRDLARPIQDLEISYRPVELRSGIEQAQLTRRPVIYKDVHWPNAAGDVSTVEVQVTPLLSVAGEFLGVSVTTEDVTQFKRLQDELINFNQELETAYEEVQSTNEELQTTNEELQSTVEELETTNEELQSTNEELETMNEELQSTNEELETINEEMRLRSTELNEANALLESILASLAEGVVVVDRNLQVMAWNTKSEDLWGLRADEVFGENLLNLDIGLPVDKLVQSIRTCLQGSGAQSASVEATNRRGRLIKCEVGCAPLVAIDRSIRGVIVLVSDSEVPTEAPALS
jgi:two-component system, chemotaxis family, CheB/CheR fusion protein